MCEDQEFQIGELINLDVLQEK